jgi:hypothetical protein
VVEAEIADVANLPDVTMNTSTITKMLSMEKPQVALVERYLHTNQQQAM